MQSFDPSARSSRRIVLGTGLKLAYGAPLVAASFKLSSLSASAEDGPCTCIEDYRSPKPGKLVNGDPKLCYVCKGVEEATTVCGNKTKGSIQVVAGPNGPVCACNSKQCEVDGVEIDRDTIIACAPEVVDCGGVILSL